MAAKYRKADPRLWRDEKFRELSRDEQLITLYLLFGPQGNRLGIFPFSPAEAAETLKLDPISFMQGFGNVVKTFSWHYDEKARVFYIPTWWKYNHPENPKVLIGNLSDLHDLPQTPLVEAFAANTRYLAHNVIDTFSKTYEKRCREPGTMFADTGTGTAAGTAAGTGTGKDADAGKLFRTLGDDVVLAFDCVRGRTSEGTSYTLTRAKLDEYAETFQGIDVEFEARKAWQFLRDNPAKRPTASGTPNFLRTWLNRAQSDAAREASLGAQRGAHSRSDARRERLKRAVQ